MILNRKLTSINVYKKKFKKNYTKFNYKGKYYFDFNQKFLRLFLKKYCSIPKKTRLLFYKKFIRNRLLLNYRIFVLKIFNLQINLFKLYVFFYKYGWGGILSLEYYKLTDFQLETIRRIVKKYLSKRVFIDLKTKPNLLVLARPAKIRMGGGKGDKLMKIIFFLYPGCLFLEFRGIKYLFLLKLYKFLKKKFGFKTKLIYFNYF